jgi:hypothetical protein
VNRLLLPNLLETATALLPSPVPTVAGRSLVHRDMTKIERTFVAVDLTRGALLATPLTVPQAAYVTGVSATYIIVGRGLSSDERHAAEHGWRPLVVPQPRKLVNDDTLIEIARCDPDRLWGALAAAEQQVAAE